MNTISLGWSVSNKKAGLACSPQQMGTIFLDYTVFTRTVRARTIDFEWATLERSNRGCEVIENADYFIWRATIFVF